MNLYVQANGNGGHHKVPIANGSSDSPTSWVVQKFGGTSVGKFALDIVEHVIQYLHPQIIIGAIAHSW
jgi:aspartate kinase